MAIKSILLSAVTVCLASTSFAQIVTSNRCEEVTGLKIFSRTYNAQETQSIRAWMKRCNPEWKRTILKNPHLNYIDAAGKKIQRIIYPVVALETYTPDPNSIDGETYTLSNPKKYDYPIDAIVKDHSSAPCNIPKEYEIVGWCGAGCFTPDQQLWFPSGDVAIGTAKDLGFKSVVTLDAQSTFNDLSFKPTSILGEKFIESKSDQEETVVTLSTRDKNLTVTENHPMLMGDGTMKDAGQLNVGDLLVNIEGDPEEIVHMKRSRFYGKVLNVETTSPNMQSHIVVAQGLLTGDFLVQNLAISQANRFLLRDRSFPVHWVQ